MSNSLKQQMKEWKESVQSGLSSEQNRLFSRSGVSYFGQFFCIQLIGPIIRKSIDLGPESYHHIVESFYLFSL